MSRVRRAAAWFERTTWPQVILAGVLGGCAAGVLAVIFHTVF